MTGPQTNEKIELSEHLEQMRLKSYNLYQKVLDDYIARNGTVTVETFVGALAALTGEFSLRVVLTKFTDAQWIVTGDHINELLFEEPNIVTVWQALSMPVLALGLCTEEDLPNWREVCQRQAAAIGSTHFPRLSVDPEHDPADWSPEACPRYRDAVFELASEYGFTPYETALFTGMATGMAIAEFHKMVHPKITLQIAADIMKGVSYMAPWDSYAELTHEMSFSPAAPENKNKINMDMIANLEPIYEWSIDVS